MSVKFKLKLEGSRKSFLFMDFIRQYVVNGVLLMTS